MFRAALAILFFPLAFFCSPGTAQESESRIKLDELKERSHHDFDEDVDDIITNHQLRAESGSKSRWSLASTLTYEGGSLETPLAEDRPNIGNSLATNPKSLLEGSLSVKMNLT